MAFSILDQFQKKTIAVQLIEEIRKKDIMKFSEIKKCMVGKHDGTIGRELKKLVKDEIIIKTEKGYSLNHTHPEIDDLLMWLNITPRNRKLHRVAGFRVPGYQNKNINVVVSTDKVIENKDLDSVFKNPGVENALSKFYGDLVYILLEKKLIHQLKDVDDEEERERIANAFINEEVISDKPFSLEIHIIPTTKIN